MTICRCLLCNKKIEFLSCNSQPNGGTEFIGGGEYGSRITDVNDRKFAIYVCDDCMDDILKTNPNRIVQFREQTSSKTKRMIIIRNKS
jgi:hypothetical protein